MSAELTSEGNQVHINSITGYPTLTDYAVGTELSDVQVPVTTSVTLQVNQQKEARILVHDLDAVQSAGDTLSEWSRRAVVTLSQTLDTFLYNTFNSNWDDSGADQNRFTHTKTITSAAHREAFVTALQDLQDKANRLNWPTEGRFMVMSTNALQYLITYFRADKPNLGSGGIVDQAVTEGSRGRLFGFELYVDNQIPIATAANNPYVLCGTTRWGAFAQQVRKTEAYRPESHFGDAVKFLWVYGAKELHKESKLALVQAA